MKKFPVLDLGALAVWMLPAIYLSFIYSVLPQSVPMHYSNGGVDRYGSKTEFAAVMGAMMGVAALVYLLLKFLPSIDPKKQVKYGEQTFQKLAFGLVVFLTALNLVIIYAAAHNRIKIEKMLFPVIGLLFVFIGNMMNSIKPNYFAGIRTPWTLENDDNWRATHRLAGKLWFIGGLFLTIAILVLPTDLGTIIFMCTIGIMVLVPVIFSYIYFRKHQLNQNL